MAGALSVHVLIWRVEGPCRQCIRLELVEVIGGDGYWPRKIFMPDEPSNIHDGCTNRQLGYLECVSDRRFCLAASEGGMRENEARVDIDQVSSPVGD